MRRDEALRILAAHRADLDRHAVKQLALFGSVARDDARPESDVDILVEFSEPVGLFGFAGLQLYLAEILGRPVDLVPRDSIRRQLRERILREAIPAN
ncbi:MAG: nucleotidyltransferase family protein [Dehalococcoidia bacterium]